MVQSELIDAEFAQSTLSSEQLGNSECTSRRAQFQNMVDKTCLASYYFYYKYI